MTWKKALCQKKRNRNLRMKGKASRPKKKKGLRLNKA